MDGTVFNIQRFSLFDGPGVRTVVFLKGCPLKCVWCHNPEGLSALPEIMYNPEACIGCLSCSVCKNQCHLGEGGLHKYLREDCVSCGECIPSCPTGALALAGKKMTVAEVIDEVMKDSIFYGDDGGITVSGGEPFLQHEFLLELLKAAKDKGINTCIETSGYVEGEILKEATEYIDLFLFDYKVTGEENHKKYCGVSQKKILDNLSILDSTGARVILRCPIISGINDNDEHVRGIGEVSRHACVLHTELEPYHKLGISKRMQLEAPITYDGEVPKKELLEAYCDRVTEISNKKCIIS